MIEWRPIPSCPLYEASAEGQIRRIGSARPLSPYLDGKYLKVRVAWDRKSHQRWVQRLVCEAFHGPPPATKLDAAHRNSISTDNRGRNLKWKTRAENEADKRPLGRANIGERNGASILTPRQVIEIRERLPSVPRSSGGKYFKKGALPELAARFGVTACCIRLIAARKLWSRLP